MNAIKVGIAEDQQIFRRGLVLLVNSFEGVRVIHEAGNGRELLEMIEDNLPDVVVLDYSMPVLGGMETTKVIREKYPDIKVIILSMYDDETFIETAIENGVNGYLSKDDDLIELNNAIKGVLSNHYYLNDRLSKIFINGLMKKGKLDPQFGPKPVDFNEEELEIIKMISKEMTTQEIADSLCKSARTIEKHRTKMLEKVGAQNSIGLIMYAIKHKIIEF